MRWNREAQVSEVHHQRAKATAEDSILRKWKAILNSASRGKCGTESTTIKQKEWRAQTHLAKGRCQKSSSFEASSGQQEAQMREIRQKHRQAESCMTVNQQGRSHGDNIQQKEC